MGMVVSITSVTAEELAKVADTPDDQWERLDELAGDDDRSVYLDKAWDGLQFLLDQAGVLASVSPTDLIGDEIDEDGTLFELSPTAVRHTAELLRATPFEKLAPHFDPAKMTERDIYPKGIWEDDEDALDYLRTHYEDVVRFFDTAARSGLAAILSWSF